MPVSTTTRLLPLAEWDRLRSIGPFAQAQTLPDPTFASVVVEENAEGEIVGCWMVTSVLLLEGLWRREDQRGIPGTGKRLLLAMIRQLVSWKIKTAITFIEDPEVEALAAKAGFVPIGEGRLHALTLETPDAALMPLMDGKE